MRRLTDSEPGDLYNLRLATGLRRGMQQWLAVIVTRNPWTMPQACWNTQWVR